MSLISNAFADGTASTAASSTSSLMSFLPMVVIFVLFWFLLIRPQQKKMKVHNQMLAALEKGTKVLTTGGIVGKIAKIEDNFIDLEIAENVVITVQRSAVAGRLDSSAQAVTAK